MPVSTVRMTTSTAYGPDFSNPQGKCAGDEAEAGGTEAVLQYHLPVDLK